MGNMRWLSGGDTKERTERVSDLNHGQALQVWRDLQTESTQSRYDLHASSLATPQLTPPPRVPPTRAPHERLPLLGRSDDWDALFGSCEPFSNHHLRRFR